MRVTANFVKVIEKQIKSAWDHGFGLHSTFAGRRYRRGKNRCSYCGART